MDISPLNIRTINICAAVLIYVAVRVVCSMHCLIDMCRQPDSMRSSQNLDKVLGCSVHENRRLCRSTGSDVKICC